MVFFKYLQETLFAPGRTFGDTSHPGKQEDGSLERAKKRPGPGKEKVPDAPIGEIKAQCSVGKDLRVEVDEERTDSVLVRLRNLATSDANSPSRRKKHVLERREEK